MMSGAPAISLRRCHPRHAIPQAVSTYSVLAAKVACITVLLYTQRIGMPDGRALLIASVLQCISAHVLRRRTGAMSRNEHPSAHFSAGIISTHASHDNLWGARPRTFARLQWAALL